MRLAKDYRETAWNILRGRYWWTVLAGLIASLLGGASARGFRFDFKIGESDFPYMVERWSHGQFDVQQLQTLLNPFVGIVASMAVLFAMYGIAVFIVGSAVELGYNSFNLSLYESPAAPKIETLFSRFPYFGNALLLRILMALKILAWTLLFVIPGIVAAYRYSMAPYIMAENPDMSAMDAIEESKRLMADKKWRLFCLQISFIGWWILASITGIGVVFLLPYTEAANAAFYLDLTGRLPLPAYAPSGTSSASYSEDSSSTKELI